MSVEETPVAAAPETSEVKNKTMPTAETTQPSEASNTVVNDEQPTALPSKDTAIPEQASKNGEAVVEATPAFEGVLGYKEAGLLSILKGYQKHYFWFSEEPLRGDSLLSYVRSEKSGLGHHNASWASQTGKGILFYSKREEDKATPAGLIMLSDISKLTKEGETEFQFKEGHNNQKFQATNSAERDSWLVALEKKAEEAKAMKEGIINSEGYKDSHAGYMLPALASSTAARDTTEPQKSLDASTAVAAPTTTTDGVAHNDVVAEEEKKDAAKKGKASSRSRSRGNRKSFFGGLLDKKEKTEDNKEVKKEEKAEKKEEKMEKKEEKAELKAEKKEIKEEKKEEAAHKKEEANATHDTTRAMEAAEATAVAAVPAAAIVAEKKHDDKEEKKTGTTTPTDKKSKRGSVFGNIFAKKNVTSPGTENTETETAPAVPAKNTEVPPVSETAPKIEEPVMQKPLDTAAVVAPVDTVQTPAAVEEPVKDKPVTPTETTSTAKEQKDGGGFLGFFKKQEAKMTGKKEPKSEVREDKAAEEVAKDPVAAAAVEPAAEPATETPVPAEERPVNPSRRSSVLERFNTLKKRPNKTSETDAVPVEAEAKAKRERSPLPTRVAGLFRKPSKAVRPTEGKANAETNGLTNGHTEPAAIPEAGEIATETKPNGTVPEHHDSAIVGDVVPGSLVHDQVTAAPEASTSA